MPRKGGGKGGSGHKHHVRKERSAGGYARRLLKRGLSRAPRMKSCRELGIKGAPQS